MEAMKRDLLGYFEGLSQNVEGKITKLSLWLGVDMTWPLVLFVGIVILVGMFLPDRSVRK